MAVWVITSIEATKQGCMGDHIEATIRGCMGDHIDLVNNTGLYG